ncbi:MAG: alpha/beta hydrolase [Actinomycetota bacterium]
MSDALDYSLLDEGGLSAQIFFPRPDPSPTPPGATDHVVAVGAAGDVSIAARRYEVDSQAATIVYFHGNGEVIGDHDWIAPLYHSIGVNLFVFEFRGYGRSTGSPTVEYLVADGRACGQRAIEILDADGFDGPRLVMGRSLGANPALEVAARVPGYRGLILESGAGDVGRFVRRLGLRPSAALDRLVAGHEAKLASIDSPSLIIHGLGDDLVPVEVALSTAELLTGSEVTMELVEGAGHNDLLLVDPGRYIAAIAELVATARA